MRSRPKIQLFLAPTPALPGRSLRAELVLSSRSDTPCDAIDVRLVGTERRLRSVVLAGNVTSAHYETFPHVSLGLRTKPQVLTKGEHRVSVNFDLPEGIPPSFESSNSTIEYELDVHVVIPWWRDRRERYLVPVCVPPRAAKGKSKTYCSHQGGPHGKELYTELSLEKPSVERGGTVVGAISFANVQWSRFRRVELAFVGVESTIDPGFTRPVDEVVRHVVVLKEGAPSEGEPLPFRVKFPEKAVPAFRGRYTSLAWFVEVRAVIALGSDVTLTVPLDVLERRLEDENPQSSRSRLPRVPPVGKERRALVWAEVATRAGLVNDAERERMTSKRTDASGGGELAITLEHRGKDGLWTVASLRWPRLGIELSVGERKWLDWKKAVDLDDASFAERLLARGREDAQVHAFLDAQTRRTLLGFTQVTVDDEGCMLASPGTAHEFTDLLAFVTRAVDAFHQLVGRAGKIPPPARFAASIDAWQRFAREHGGRLELGRPYIHDATWDREPMELGTRWIDGEPSATLARFRLPPDLADTADLASLLQTKAAELQIAANAPRIVRGHLEATFAAPLADPSVLGPELDRLAVLARALRGEREGGPYR